MLVLKIKEKSFIYSRHKNIYQPLFISTLWLSGSARVEAELYPDYRNHSRRLSQFTTYCNLHFLLLSAPYCKGSRGINNKSRKNRTDICIYNIHPCCCRATGAGAVPGTTEVFTALCANSPWQGKETASEWTKIQCPGLGRSAKPNSPWPRASPRPWVAAETQPRQPQGDAGRVDPSCSRVGARGAVVTTRLQSPAKSSVCPVLPLLVFFILPFVGTLGAEPLHLFWGCSCKPNARPARDRKISHHLSGVTLLLFLTPKNATFQWETGSGLQINIAIIIILMNIMIET